MYLKAGLLLQNLGQNDRLKNGLPRWLSGKEYTCQDAGDVGPTPGLGTSCGGGNGKPASVFLKGKSHRQRSLAGYRPWSHKESDVT